MIAGDDSHKRLHRGSETRERRGDGIAALMFPGRPGNPDSEADWFAEDWMDTARAQQVLSFQRHPARIRMPRFATRMGWKPRPLRAVAPMLARVMRRKSPYYKMPGQYADPWGGIRDRWGDPGPDAARYPPLTYRWVTSSSCWQAPVLRTLNCLWTRDVVGVVDGGAATDDGSPLVQLCEVWTAAKTGAEIADYASHADHQRDQRALAPVRIGLLRGPFLRIVGHTRMVKRCDQQQALSGSEARITANQQHHSDLTANEADSRRLRSHHRCHNVIHRTDSGSVGAGGRVQPIEISAFGSNAGVGPITRTRCSISSRMGRTASTGCPAGSASSHSS